MFSDELSCHLLRSAQLCISSEFEQEQKVESKKKRKFNVLKKIDFPEQIYIFQQHTRKKKEETKTAKKLKKKGTKRSI